MRAFTLYHCTALIFIFHPSEGRRLSELAWVAGCIQTVTHPRSNWAGATSLLAICRPSGCTVASGVVVVVVVVCNRSQMRTSKCTCLFFGVSIDLGPG